ncbi:MULTISPECIES: phosphatidate cytidylyltransferase [Roseivirga]|jgi:phosphatidate cytidylyltransferase|uniref:Phosphatidate cytidylyltransferase n=1 Tax=Roseivirga thermotolerans TaxID=1758176 RepID=A0ABQ3I9Z2_9BACT|nr:MULTISPECIES: phosphatidate cytidylyltransferase [Roseivirga]MEC7754599.1 phosphatidate cytidylyltransferase [Bacteroidota bacterium]GHE74716.1 phosphatidate cytidylyltransferase [Roseivirga thermotolerans]|tara:strand:- start:29 stop:841 length:813 start_codon:yes stop_codon:yes gene_type:complete
MSNLLQRIITAFIGVAGIIAAIAYSPYGFAIVFALLMLACLKEFYGLAKKDGKSPYEIWGLGLALALFSGLFAFYQFNLSAEYFWFLPALFAIAFIYPLQTIKTSHAINCLAISILGFVYIAFPFSLVNAIAYIEGAYAYPLVLGILFLQWATDTGAFFAGRSLGKRKLFEKVSPNKTWEGAMGGLALALVIAYCLHQLFGIISLYEWFGLALITAVFGILGDLVESLFKRTLAIKDSGRILPGHGGFLDRFDGLLLSLPFTTAYLHFIL